MKEKMDERKNGRQDCVCQYHSLKKQLSLWSISSLSVHEFLCKQTTRLVSLNLFFFFLRHDDFDLLLFWPLFCTYILSPKLMLNTLVLCKIGNLN